MLRKHAAICEHFTNTISLIVKKIQYQIYFFTMLDGLEKFRDQLRTMN